MTASIRICVAALLGLWIVAGVAQEAAEEGTAAADAQQEVAAEASPEAATAAAGETVEADTAEQPEIIADVDATEAGAIEPGEAFPEVPPLDELFVPSQNIRADEPVTFPVDF